MGPGVGWAEVQITLGSLVASAEAQTDRLDIDFERGQVEAEQQQVAVGDAMLPSALYLCLMFRAICTAAKPDWNGSTC